MKILLLAKSKWQNYASAIEACGATAIVKYIPDESTDYDGLVLCGGNDIHPSYYNENICGAHNFDLARDEAEMRFLRKFISTGKPILGICRGHQLLNVALGGSLIQDLENSSVHSSGNTEIDLVHEVKASEASIFEKIYKKSFFVNSHHHQALKSLGSGLIPTLYSSDGIIEGCEHSSFPYISVQFHPERMCLKHLRNDTVDGLQIFRYFLELCQKAP